MIPIRDSVPCRRPTAVVTGLIAVNAIVFLLVWSMAPQGVAAVIADYALIPRRYADPAWARAHGLDPGDYLPFLTNTFLHGGWLHVIFNMWTLWIFGCGVEDRLGAGRFTLLYFACGIAASATHFAFNAASPVPALGASGAIAGVIGAYTVRFPHARVLLVVPIFFFPLLFQIPAVAFAAIWFGLQILQGTQAVLAPSLGGGIAWWAHVGGFVSGVGLILVLRGRPGQGPRPPMPPPPPGSRTRIPTVRRGWGR
jgi:membrane associated rhomboid family serine protease